jgi:two-component system nitrogen regulation response regulator GlnG
MPELFMTADSLPGTARQSSSCSSIPSTEEGALDIVQLVTQMLAAGKKGIYREVEIEVDRAVLQAVLRYTKGNQVEASELLGISRTTLRAKLRNLRVVIEKQVSLKFGKA